MLVSSQGSQLFLIYGLNRNVLRFLHEVKALLFTFVTKLGTTYSASFEIFAI